LEQGASINIKNFKKGQCPGRKTFREGSSGEGRSDRSWQDDEGGGGKKWTHGLQKGNDPNPRERGSRGSRQLGWRAVEKKRSYAMSVTFPGLFVQGAGLSCYFV